jgi:DNA-binding CsgD family transcriptional regulator/uncharacterized membrane protein YciS (DUF1049 family)
MRFLGFTLTVVTILAITIHSNSQNKVDNGPSWNQFVRELDSETKVEEYISRARSFSRTGNTDSVVFYLEKARIAALLLNDKETLQELTSQLNQIYDGGIGPSYSKTSTYLAGTADIAYTPLLIFVLVIIGFIALNIVTFLAYKKQRERSKKLLRKLKKKNKELTGASLKLLKQNMDIEHVGYKLRQLKSQQISIDRIEKIAGTLTNIPQGKEQLWENFKFNFEEDNEEFYNKLHGKHPNISQQDIKVCTLLRMNFTSKEVASILGISYDGVRKARHRLRKKMDLSKETSLEKYLTSM